MTWRNAITSSNDNVLIAIHVVPGSARDEFPGPYNSWRRRLSMQVRAEALDNQANVAVVELIARALGISRQEVMLVNGEKSRQKTVAIRGHSVAEVAAGIEALYAR